MPRGAGAVKKDTPRRRRQGGAAGQGTEPAPRLERQRANENQASQSAFDANSVQTRAERDRASAAGGSGTWTSTLRRSRSPPTSVRATSPSAPRSARMAGIHTPPPVVQCDASRQSAAEGRLSTHQRASASGASARPSVSAAALTLRIGATALHHPPPTTLQSARSAPRSSTSSGPRTNGPESAPEASGTAGRLRTSTSGRNMAWTNASGMIGRTLALTPGPNRERKRGENRADDDPHDRRRSLVNEPDGSARQRASVEDEEADEQGGQVRRHAARGDEPFPPPPAPRRALAHRDAMLEKKCPGGEA